MGDPRYDDAERVVLFDIDGTLIRAAKRREYRHLTRSMLIDLFGTCGRLAEVDFSGKTDLAIYTEALAGEGITLDSIMSRLDALEAAKIAVIERMAADGGDVFEVCRGARELLESLNDDRRYVSSLLTGNLERLAEAKLRLVGLWDYFKVRGAFGSDHPDRDQLPSIAAARIRAELKKAFAPERFVIVGDTPRDIACARHFGARVIAVASGQHSAAQLREFSPDLVLADLSDTAEVLGALETV
jgi:phosphoglycolate phosphatase-like HAD superfamily hydrolase